MGINLQGFVFQLITFLLVLLILRKYVFPKLVETMEKRRQTLEQSLLDAKKTQEALARAEDEAASLLGKARQDADNALAEAASQARQLIAKAEQAADERAQRLLDEAKSQIDQERVKLRQEIKGELADLVVTATEKVLRGKLDAEEDGKLIEKSIKEVVR